MERYYTIKDMARIGCRDCQGCSDCCQGMGDTVVLGPMDLFLLQKNLGKSTEELMQERLIDMHQEYGQILPHLVMKEVSSPRVKVGEAGAISELSRQPEEYEIREQCVFLDENGRCSIHAFRPGICRLFPLGRDYGDMEKGLKYFVLEDACPQTGKTKVRIDKWIGMKDAAAYEDYLIKWHALCKKVQRYAELAAAEEDPEEQRSKENTLKQLNMFVLQQFFFKPYETDKDFRPQFEDRLAGARAVLG